jgi:hypothetical protein
MDSPMRELGASLSATPGGNDVRLKSGAQNATAWRPTELSAISRAGLAES